MNFNPINVLVFVCGFCVADETSYNKTSTDIEKYSLQKNTIQNLKQRPFFSGSTATLPPRVKPGKPWPSRPQDYADFSVTTPRIPQIDDRFKETTTEKRQPSSNVISNIPKPNRPSFAGSATTHPPKVKPGKPWPSRPQEYADFSDTTLRIPQIDDRFKETTTEKSHPSNNVNVSQILNGNIVSNVISSIPKPNRPSFAGSVTTPPPRVQPGKPWPSRPQDYADFSDTTPRIPQIDDRFKETTTTKSQPSNNVNVSQILNGNIVSNVISSIPKPNRPSFAGSGTTPPPKVKPGKPWPSRPQDYADFSNTTPRIPQIDDRFKETTTEKSQPSNNLNASQIWNGNIVTNVISSIPKPNRPSFAGSATTLPPIVKPQKPWPPKPQDYADFIDTTTRKPQIEDRFKETTTTERNSVNLISNLPITSRPSFCWNCYS